MSDVIELAAFRRPAAAVDSSPASELRISISKSGKIDFRPVKIEPIHALALLQMILATAVYCLEFHIDSEGGA
jgi:hypothetical protein